MLILTYPAEGLLAKAVKAGRPRNFDAGWLLTQQIGSYGVLPRCRARLTSVGALYELRGIGIGEWGVDCGETRFLPYWGILRLASTQSCEA